MKERGGEAQERQETSEKWEITREKVRSVGSAVLDVVSIESDAAKLEVDNRAEFQELVDEIEGTDVEVLDSLAPSNRTEAEVEFLMDEGLAHPNFRFDKIDAAQVVRNLAELSKIDEKIDESGEFSDKQQLLLRMVAADKRSKNQLLQAADDYNHAPSEQAKAVAKQEFQKMNMERYGKVDEATFESLLLEKFETIKVENLSDEQKRAYEDLKKKLKIDELGRTERFCPQPETVERFGGLMEMLYENLFQHIPEGKEKFTPEEVQAIVQEVLDEEFGGKLDWRAEYAPDAAALVVNKEQKVIRVPGKRARGEFTAEQVRAIVIGHELGTHAYRSIAHDANPITMMKKSLPGSEEFDEGVAVCVQQALMHEYPESRDSFHYINIGLATFRGMNFREIFETQKSFHELLTAKRGETAEELDARRRMIERRAFVDVTRCFRGTGELVCNKDLVYQRGSDQVWQYIEERIDDSEALLRDLFLSGKTNQLNPDQARLTYEAYVNGL